MVPILIETVPPFKTSLLIWKLLSRLIHFGLVVLRMNSKVPVKLVSA
jgi:hypothetical protein